MRWTKAPKQGCRETIRFEGRDERGWQPLREFPDPPRETRSYGFNTDADAIARSCAKTWDWS